MEKLKENSEIDMENLKFENDENLENQNEPKLLYRLDKRNIFYVFIDCVIFFIFVLISIGAIFSFENIFVKIIAFVGLLFGWSKIIGIIFFDYIEIYGDRIVAKNFILGKKIIRKIDILDYHIETSRTMPHTCSVEIIVKFNKFKFIYAIANSLTINQADKLKEQIFKMQISKF